MPKTHHPYPAEKKKEKKKEERTPKPESGLLLGTLSYYVGEAILITIYTHHCGNLS